MDFLITIKHQTKRSCHSLLLFVILLKKSVKNYNYLYGELQQSAYLFQNICNGLGEYWAGPLACLSRPSVMSWIRSVTPIWKLALSQSCSPRIKRSQQRVKCCAKSKAI